MFIVLEELKSKVNGVRQTLVASKESKKLYIVSSATHHGINETMIFKANAQGDVTNWCELYCTKPADHDYVLNELKSGMLRESDFFDAHEYGATVANILGGEIS